MSARPFLGKESKPETATLEVALGPAFLFYRDFIRRCSGFKQEWLHTKGGGWMLKASDAKKADQGGYERVKAVVRDRYGTPDVLELREVAKPTPGADQVLVRVLAASVNDWDWGMLCGSLENRLLGGLLRPRVRVLGCDIAGRVEAVGGAVTAFQPGDEVHGDLSGCGFGAFAEYA